MLCKKHKTKFTSKRSQFWLLRSAPIVSVHATWSDDGKDKWYRELCELAVVDHETGQWDYVARPFGDGVYKLLADDTIRKIAYGPEFELDLNCDIACRNIVDLQTEIWFEMLRQNDTSTQSIPSMRQAETMCTMICGDDKPKATQNNCPVCVAFRTSNLFKNFNHSSPF